MKKLIVYLIALSVLLPTAMVAANSTPQKPPKITRRTKPAAKPTAKPRTPAKSSQSSRPMPLRVNQEPLTNRIFTANSVSFKMVGVQGGTFEMGSNDGEDDEKPVHNVTLSSYYIGQTEVTQALWKAVMGSNPSELKGDNLPVETVSWDDCQSFITKLNHLTGEHFRLPTEAEWEFAAKGGRQSRGFEYSGRNTIGDVAWYDGNSGSKTHPVATKSPNELGIYDMSGNVYEWCQDGRNWFDTQYSGKAQTNPKGSENGTHRVCRSGGWNDTGESCRNTSRYMLPCIECTNDLGFRLALEPF